jgi:nitrite reductase/ring-hydroxylating ferredoxin subunit
MQMRVKQKILVNVGALPDLAVKGRSLVKINGKQIAVFKDEHDQIFAINNRCPHEGYPLIEGTLTHSDEAQAGRLPKCKLACNWHGWAFDLGNGMALEGRDPVRTYWIEKQGDEYFIDVSDIPKKVRVEQAYAEFDEAIGEHDYERIARALCRLEAAGEPLENSLKRVLLWSDDRFERGIAHPHAGLVDWMLLADQYPKNRTLAYLEAIGHFSWDGMMDSGFSFNSDIREWNPVAFMDAIENIHEEKAGAIAKGGIKAGISFGSFKPLFQKIIFNHYMGFGHPAIYLMKAEALIEKIGVDIEGVLILQITRYLTKAAREDLIPEFKAFQGYMKTDTALKTLPAKLAGTGFDLPKSGDNVRKALEKTAHYAGNLTDLWESLLREGAVNMLRFDVSLQNNVEQPIAKNIGWLDFTHAITFAEAVHYHVQTAPDLERSGVLQMACFVGRNAAYLGENEFDRYRVDNHHSFLAACKNALFNMDEGEYIYSVHRLKMIMAVENLLMNVTPETADILVAALNKYLSSKLRMRHPARALYQARQTVLREG